jgi:hypothetical protein
MDANATLHPLAGRHFVAVALRTWQLSPDGSADFGSFPWFGRTALFGRGQESECAADPEDMVLIRDDHKLTVLAVDFSSARVLDNK